MLKIIAGLFGLSGMAAIPAQASTAHEDLAGAKVTGTIEALEDLAWRHPGLKAAIRLELARFECAQGQQWKCGADGRVDQARKGYGG